MNQILKLFVMVGFLCCIQGCSSEAPLDKKTRLLKVLQNMETAIEAKSLDNFMAYVSDDFELTDRGYNKKDAERLLRIRLMRQKNVHVHQAVRDIEWLNEGEEQATVEVVAALAGSAFSLSELPKIRAELAKFRVTFQLIDDSYVVTQTTWERATPADFVF